MSEQWWDRIAYIFDALQDPLQSRLPSGQLRYSDPKAQINTLFDRALLKISCMKKLRRAGIIIFSVAVGGSGSGSFGKGGDIGDILQQKTKKEDAWVNKWSRWTNSLFCVFSLGEGLASPERFLSFVDCMEKGEKSCVICVSRLYPSSTPYSPWRHLPSTRYHSP